jgi:hypothetical protein
MHLEQSKGRSRTRALRKWSRVAPKTVGERSALMAKCGRRCFLGSRKTFPICQRLGSGSGAADCKIDRRGVLAAYSRAREWASITARKKRTSASHRKYTAIARRARAILHPR